MRTITMRALCAILATLAAAGMLRAQQLKAPMPAPAPVPPEIASAQKVFISNAGGESLETVIDEVVFNGGPDRAYNQFYAAMKSWRRYQIVPSPAEADVILEISWVLSDTGLRLPLLGQLRLRVLDPKSNITLWNLTEYVRGAILLSNRDKNFDQAMNTIVSRIEALAEPLPAPAAH